MDDTVYHFAFCPVVFDQFVFLFDGLCFLEFHFHSQCLHLIHQEITNNLRVSFQNLFDFIDVFQVFCVGLFADAWTLTVLDVVFQTYIELSVTDVFRCQGVMAGAYRIEFLD